MILKNIGIILFPGLRSRAYLQKLVEEELIPACAVLVEGEYSSPQLDEYKNFAKDFFDISKLLADTLKENNIPCETVKADSVNSPAIVEALKKSDQDVFIYTGGGIVKKEIFETGKKLIHMHPGRVPDYRGSTCFYYSMINENNCSATAFFMEETVDTGSVIAQKTYLPPKIKSTQGAFFDNIYDPYIRADLLTTLLKEYAKTKEFKPVDQDTSKGESYHIIHPVLKHIAILGQVQ